MSRCTLSGVFAVACVLLLTVSGTLYVLMALALRRRGTHVQLLSLSFDPRTRLAIAGRVIREYKQLCEQRGRLPLLYLLLCASIPLALGCAAASFAVLAGQK